MGENGEGGIHAIARWTVGLRVMKDQPTDARVLRVSALGRAGGRAMAGPVATAEVAG